METFKKICRESQILGKIKQKYLAPFRKTCARFSVASDTRTSTTLRKRAVVAKFANGKLCSEGQ
jgi:hypothetical protein